MGKDKLSTASLCGVFMKKEDIFFMAQLNGSTTNILRTMFIRETNLFYNFCLQLSNNFE